MRRHHGAALVAVVLATAAAGCSSDSGDPERIATLEQQVDDLARENRELREQLNGSGAPASTVAPTSAPADDADDADDADVRPAGARTDRLDPAVAVQRDLQADKITLWALSDAGLVDVGDTWGEAVEQLENCDTWANDPATAQAALEDEFATRVYRIVLDHYCPEFLPLLEEAAPPPVTVAELNATLGAVAAAWLAEPSVDTYDAIATVADTLLKRPLPAELSIDPARSAAQSLRELTQYPGSDDAVREILARLAIGEEYVAAEAAAATTSTSVRPTTSPATGTPTTGSPPPPPAGPVTVDELNAVFGPVVQEWVITPNPVTYDAMLATAEELLRRPLPDDLTDDDSVDPADVLRSLDPYPGSDTEVITILDQLALDVAL